MDGREISSGNRGLCFPHHIQTTCMVDPTLVPNVYLEQIEQGVKFAII
jgi:hypothetical protein